MTSLENIFEIGILEENKSDDKDMKNTMFLSVIYANNDQIYMGAYINTVFGKGRKIIECAGNVEECLEELKNKVNNSKDLKLNDFKNIIVFYDKDTKDQGKSLIKTIKEKIGEKISGVEVELKEGQLENLQLLLETIVRMKRVESYQRYRNVFCNDEVEIVVDKYPFGIALEIENKSKIKNGEEIIRKWLNILNLDIQEAFKLSWDDKYTSLCEAQGIKPVKDVIFDDNITMPKV